MKTKKVSDNIRYQEIKKRKDQELEDLVKEREDELIYDEDTEIDDESDLTGRLESKNLTILPDGIYIGFIDKNHSGVVNVFYKDKLYYFDFGFNNYIFPSKHIYSILVSDKKGYLSHRNHVFIRLNIKNSINFKEKEIKSIKHIIEYLNSGKSKTSKETLDVIIKNHRYQIDKLSDELNSLKIIYDYLLDKNYNLEKSCISRIDELKNLLEKSEILIKEKKNNYTKEYIKFYGKENSAKMDTLNEPTELRFARKLLRDAENLSKNYQVNIHRLECIHKTLKL